MAVALPLALVSIGLFMSGSLGSAHCSYLKDFKENLRMNTYSTTNNENFHEWGTVLLLIWFAGLSMDDLLGEGLKYNQTVIGHPHNSHATVVSMGTSCLVE